ncbi:moesin/ezrin/radixin homolog 1-like [Agrilus planipennis]|uniref:Moesin/ezrin/radixin homolog 1 n=1 Tax=Agrilus planipennis TaxID=224129 RepID=A0A1W4XDA9_AGRPL|nr:moesin/ezrin/radixin homolog 1-like [Agrilus planipennis]
MAKMVTIKVTTMDTELEFASPAKTRTVDLFYQISKNISIREVWFFGLVYQSSEGEEVWIDGSKKPIKAYASRALSLRYRIKYYPEDVSQELVEDITIRYFFLQVRSAILSDKIYSPPETCVLLASYAAQARYGDYNSRKKKKELSKEKLLPERVFNQFSMDRDDWEHNIVVLWEKHYGMLQEDAMLEYLKIAQNLDMYGVSYFEIHNKKGTKLLLGVTALGLNIYKLEDKLNPIIAFPWSEIKNINFRDKKFTIKSIDRDSKDFIFFSHDAKINKRILNLSIGNHSLYVRRRKPDTLEVMQMKAKAAELKKQRLEQRQAFEEERLALEKALKRESQYIEEIQNLRSQMNDTKRKLEEAQNIIQKLQEQLTLLQRAKDQLEQQQWELKEMMERLEQTKNMEEAEKRRLEAEIDAKRLEVLEKQREVELKDMEAKRLEREVEEAKRKEEELRALREEENAKRKEGELETLPNGVDHSLPSMVKVNQQLVEQLKALKTQLMETKDDSKETHLDRIHRENVRQGRDKYKTLNEIRKGNTVRRVDMFENL